MPKMPKQLQDIKLFMEQVTLTRCIKAVFSYWAHVFTPTKSSSCELLFY